MSSRNHHDTRGDNRPFAEIAGGNGGSRRRRLSENPTTTTTTNQVPSGSSFNFITGGEMGKMLFTASQWREFESQTMIYKYILASIPIPPQLLLPLSIQSNRYGSGTELRFSNGSDPEPWRCRRTDGKKWRCSKDAMPDQKYCDRHAHKNRPRSRKLVESSTQSHNDAKLPSCPFRSNHDYHPTLPPVPGVPTSCQESRFMKSGTIPLSSLSQKIQRQMVSPSVGSKRDHFCHQDDCSLTLSMQSGGSGNGVYEDQDLFQMGIGGMLNATNGLNPPSQWVNQDSWLGGPLGEALCLGIASTQKQPPNVSSLHGHSNQDMYQN